MPRDRACGELEVLQVETLGQRGTTTDTGKPQPGIESAAIRSVSRRKSPRSPSGSRRGLRSLRGRLAVAANGQRESERREARRGRWPGAPPLPSLKCSRDVGVCMMCRYLVCSVLAICTHRVTIARHGKDKDRHAPRRTPKDHTGRSHPPARRAGSHGRRSRRPRRRTRPETGGASRGCEALPQRTRDSAPARSARLEEPHHGAAVVNLAPPLPRSRGDGPETIDDTDPVAHAPPLARGSTGQRHHRHARVCRSPARAGIVSRSQP